MAESFSVSNIKFMLLYIQKNSILFFKLKKNIDVMLIDENKLFSMHFSNERSRIMMHIKIVNIFFFC